MRTLSLANLTIVDALPAELIDAAQAGGFDAIGLRIRPGNPLPMAREIVGHPEVVREIRRGLAQTGLRVLDTEAFAMFPETKVEDYEGALDVAVELGARFVNATGCDPDEARTLDRFVALCERAARRGLTVALEFLPYRSVRTLAEARQLIEKAAQPNAGLVIDALHLSRSGGHPDDLVGLPPGTITHVQLCDAAATLPSLEELPNEARTGRLYPGEGVLWLDRLLEVLPADLPLALEAPVKRTAHLPPRERGRIAGAALRTFLKRVPQS